MSFEKLTKVAMGIKNTFPEYSNEILKIAQDLSSNQSDSNLAVNNLNPNIDTKYVQQTQAEQPKERHTLELTLEVPAGYDELKIMNSLLPVTKQIEDAGIALKGYKFKES